jgi:hypothetical protein
MRKVLPLLAAALLAALSILSAGCLRQSQGTIDDIFVFRHGQPLVPAGMAPVVYINVRDPPAGASGMAHSWAQQFPAWSQAGLSLTANPSKAGYILEVSTMAYGPTDGDDVAAQVAQGYGIPARLTGKEGMGLVLDILLVARDADDAEKSLRSVARRRNVSNSQLRIGLYDPHPPPKDAVLPSTFPEKLAIVLAGMLKQGTP